MNISDIFSFLDAQRATGNTKFEDDYTLRSKKFFDVYNRYKSLIVTFQFLNNIVTDKSQGKIMFLSAKFTDLIWKVKEHHKVFVLASGRQDPRQCLKHNLSFMLVWRWRAELHEIHQTQDQKRLLQLVADVKSFLKEHQPKALILTNDSLPLERTILLAAKSLSIPTFTVQHGIFMSAANPILLDGHYSDYMLVWGDYFKEMYVEKQIKNADEVFTLGYPLKVWHTQDPEASKPATGNPVVCIFGQPWENYAEVYGEAKRAIVNKIIQACSRENVKVVYRPHPGEDRSRLLRELPALNLTDKRENLEQAIERYHAFLSITSTALLEASLRGKTAVQIYDPTFNTDNMEDIGACYAVRNNSEDIREVIRQLSEGKLPPKQVSSRYISVPADLGRSFRNILENLSVGAKN